MIYNEALIVKESILFVTLCFRNIDYVLYAWVLLMTTLLQILLSISRISFTLFYNTLFLKLKMYLCLFENDAQTNYGDIEFGFFPNVAPKTVEHIFKLVRLGGYNTNHFFRVLSNSHFYLFAYAFKKRPSIGSCSTKAIPTESIVNGSYLNFKALKGNLENK